MRRDARVDTNQADVVATLRAAGVKVRHLHMVGQGCPDLIACDPYGVLWLIEVKSAGGELTPAQVEFQEEWPVLVVTDAIQALEAMNLI